MNQKPEALSTKNLFSVANLLTLINAASGCIAIVLIIQGHVKESMYCTAISLLADFFDGYAARKLGSHGVLGQQLDSLADAISFGVVPSMLFFSLLYTSLFYGAPALSISRLALSSLAFVLALFAILRLAKFNIDTRQSTDFIGLATPAMTLFVQGYMSWIYSDVFHFSEILKNPWIIFLLIASLSFLMIAELPMFSLKLKEKHWNKNKVRYGFLFVSALLLILFRMNALCVIILLYVLLSVIRYFRK